jgi:hypothetical protein
MGGCQDRDYRLGGRHCVAVTTKGTDRIEYEFTTIVLNSLITPPEYWPGIVVAANGAVTDSVY